MNSSVHLHRYFAPCSEQIPPLLHGWEAQGCGSSATKRCYEVEFQKSTTTKQTSPAKLVHMSTVRDCLLTHNFLNPYMHANVIGRAQTKQGVQILVTLTFRIQFTTGPIHVYGFTSLVLNSFTICIHVIFDAISKAFKGEKVRMMTNVSPPRLHVCVLIIKLVLMISIE